MTAFLQVKDLGWRAGDVPILERVGLEVRPGEFVALMGLNGAGRARCWTSSPACVSRVAALCSSTAAVWTIGMPAISRAVCHLPQLVRADVSFSRWSRPS